MTGSDRRTRGPAAVYLSLTVALVALVAALSFRARQPPPPSVAELTPQAQHQITKAPAQLGSNLGSALGGRCGGGPCAKGSGPGAPTTTSTTVPGAPPTTIDELSVHHCFGNPPRQIEDTQSPPCVAYWAGNNGGATSTGVTGNEIRVVLPDQAGYDIPARMADLQAFFNHYFEFYGRQMVLIPGTASSGSSADSCSAEQAFADGIAQSYRPFAATDPDVDAPSCFILRMSQDKVISVGMFP